MTINERVSDERLNTIKSWRETYGQNANVMIPASEAESIISELQQYRAAEPVLYCMESDRLDDEAVSACKEVVDAWVDEWNGEGRCPGEPQYRTVPLYRHAAPQVTSVPVKIDLLRAHYNYDGNDFEVRAYQRGWNDCVAAAPAVQAEHALQNFRAAMEGIGHIRRTLEETFGGLHGTHCEPDVLVECKAICDAIYAAYRKTGNPPVIPDDWIPVSERMPETMTSVLVTGTWFHHAVSFWDGASWCDLDYEPPVTHWMPLPAAPKQEAE